MPAWTTALKVIPWAELIAAAPAVARGARRLWAAVHEREAMAGGAGAESGVTALQAQVDELRRELAAAAEVTAAVAEQNARLIEAIGVLRARTRLLTGACGLLALGLVAAFLLR